MQGLPTSLLKTVGTLIQKSFQTNTAKEMIEDSVSICTNRSSAYHIARLSATVLLGGGCTALFIVEPTVSSYFLPLIEQGLPFLGAVGSKVALGFVGYWIGGALGSCTVKAIKKEISLQKEGFRNPRLKFTEEDLKRIVKNNPQFFPPTGDLEPSAENIEGVRRMLKQARDQIQNFREDQRLEDKRKYKKALVEAIYKGNLNPLVEVFSATLAEQETSNRITVQTVQNTPNRPNNFLLSSQNLDEARRPDNQQAYVDREANVQETTGLLPTNPLGSVEPVERKSEDIQLRDHSELPYQARDLESQLSANSAPTDQQKTDAYNQKALLFTGQKGHSAMLRNQAQVLATVPKQLMSVLPIYDNRNRI